MSTCRVQFIQRIFLCINCFSPLWYYLPPCWLEYKMIDKLGILFTASAHQEVGTSSNLIWCFLQDEDRFVCLCGMVSTATLLGKCFHLSTLPQFFNSLCYSQLPSYGYELVSLLCLTASLVQGFSHSHILKSCIDHPSPVL